MQKNFEECANEIKVMLDEIKEQNRDSEFDIEENDNYTDFEGMTTRLRCGSYFCTNSGVKFHNGAEWKIVCLHPISIKRKFKNIEDNKEKLELEFRTTSGMNTIIVDRETISSKTSITKLAAYGINATSENAKLLVSYLSILEHKNQKTIEVSNSITHLGWVKGFGFSPYVENLVFDGEEKFKKIFNACRENGDFQKWIDIVKKVRSEKTEIRYLISASFSSVLLEPFGMLPFFLHSWCKTGKGKTVALMLAASVWANPKIGEYITTFNSTATGQEMTASFLNNLPMCIDELEIQNSFGNTEHDNSIYYLTEGTGRTRGAKNGGLQKQNTWCNCFITTGENPITNDSSKSGALNRIIEFEYKNNIYSNPLELFNIIRENYGFAGKKFIEYLSNEQNIVRIKNLKKNFYNELLKNDVTEKQAGALSLLLAVDVVINDLFFQDNNCLTIAETLEIAKTNADIDQNNQILEYVYQIVERNPNKFKTNNYGEYSNECWGFSEDGYIYILKSVFDEILKKKGFHSETFLSWANKQNLLRYNDEKRLSLQKRIGRTNKKVRYIALIENADRQTTNSLDNEDMEVLKAKLERAEQIIKEHRKIWDRIAPAATAYCKKPCVETADLFFKAVYNVDRKKN